MRTKSLLITAAAITLIAGTGAFAQQEQGGRGAPNVAPGAMHQGAGAVPGGGAPAQHGPAENSRRNSAEQRGEPSSPSRTGQVQQNRGRGETTGQAVPRNER